MPRTGTSEPPAAQLIDIRAGSRERLLHVAIRLFAEKGIDAVSLRTINAAAGSRNKSAVHYHFGSKAGIVGAIVEMLGEKAAPVFDDLIGRLEKRAKTGDVTLPEILLAFYMPFFLMRTQGGIGPDVIKLASRMMIEPAPEFQKLFRLHFERHLVRIYRLVRKQLPGKPDADLRFQLMHGTMATIMGIATIGLMDDTPLGDIRFRSELEMMFSYVDYVAGGLGNLDSSARKIDAAFWQEFLRDQRAAALTFG